MMRKRILTLFLSLLLVMSQAVLVGAEGEAELLTFKAESLDMAVTLVSGLDVIPGATNSETYLNSAMSRADFALILAELDEVDSAIGENAYRDIDESTKNYNAISYAIEMDYMAGSKGLFKPNDPINYGDAVKGLVMVSGNHIRQQGTSISSYLRTASTCGIGKGFSVDAKSLLSNGAVIRLVYQMLHSRYYEPVKLGSGGIEYKMYKSYLEAKLSVTKINGILTAAAYTGIKSAKGAGSSKITIDETTYLTEKSWDKYLGLEVDAYIQEVEGEKIAKIIIPTDVNVSAEMSPDRIEKISADKKTLTYWENDEMEDVEEIRLTYGTSVIYNGVFAGTVNDFTCDELILHSKELDAELTGSIKIIDNDDDGVCDVYMLWEYETYFISSFDNSAREYIDALSYRALNIDEICVDRVVVYDEGEEADLSSISAEKIINVAIAKDKSLATIYISGKMLENAKIEAIEDGERIKIGGVFYETSDYYKKYFENDARFRIAPGEIFTFTVDAFGKLASVELSSDSALVYGYLVGIHPDKKFDSTYKVKLFGDMGDEYKFEVFEVADKVLVNSGDKIKESDLDTISELFRVDGATGEKVAIDQLIKYSTNEAGEINKILTASETNTIKNNLNFSYSAKYYSEEPFALNYEGKVGYKGTAGLIGNKYRVNGDVVWSIPEDITDEESFRVSGSSALVNDKKDYQAKIYDVDKSLTPGAIVIRQSSTASFTVNSSVIVSEIKKGMNSKGEEVYLFKGYTLTNPSGVLNASETSYTCEDAVMLDGISVGDIIRRKANPYGVITDVELVHDWDSGVEYSTNDKADYTSDSSAYTPGSSPGKSWGKLLFATQATTGLTTDNGETFVVYGKWEACPYIIVDKEKKEVKIDTNPSLYGFNFGAENAEEVFVIGSYLRALMIVVYK